MAVNGRVVTGFSCPMVGKYTATGSTITYSEQTVLARGVSVSFEVESSDENRFYADNQVAETAPGSFTSGTVTLTVDGLFSDAKKLIFGLPDPAASSTPDAGFVKYGDSMDVPYIGLGYIVRYQSDGVVTYVPQFLPKVRFSITGGEYNTQEDEIDWQTQELTATIMRGDDENHTWFYDSATSYSTEAAAKAALASILGASV